jgi:glutamate dehydrogenase/leucine dehydrogenase
MEEWDREEIDEKLQKKMQRATDAVFDKQQELNGSLERLGLRPQGDDQAREVGNSRLAPADLRTAAYVVALSRVAQTASERGVWP